MHLLKPGSITPILLGLVLLFWNCKSDPKNTATVAEPEPEPEPTVEIVTNSMEFIGPDTIPSGWNTFVYKNNSTEPHFILLDKYPEGVTIKNTIAEVAPAFEEGMQLIMEGKNEAAMGAFGKLPEWFSDVVFSGGPGLISPGLTATTMVNLSPGYYVMECYVRMPDGRFHTSMGMAKELIVTEDPSGVTPPEDYMDVRIDRQAGISWNGQPKAGKNTFRVTFASQSPHEHFVGHDVNLVAIAPDADLEALEAWMNWATPTGLMSSTLPEGFTFLGGANDSPAETTQYFEADLTPGRYAFVAEVPDSQAKGMLKTFLVSE